LFDTDVPKGVQIRKCILLVNKVEFTLSGKIFLIAVFRNAFQLSYPFFFVSLSLLFHFHKTEMKKKSSKMYLNF